MKGYDVRTVANVVLRRARDQGKNVTNLHLNKSLFFMHVDCLRDYGQPLVSAKIEAWEYGPVFREVYNQFKKYRAEPIMDYAKRVNYRTGELEDACDELPQGMLEYIQALADFYLSVPARVLVDVSHAKGGAWDMVWSNSGDFNAGMEITESLIRDFEVPHGRRIKLQ
ncbi:MAG: DUF4065 domain-containing protein [Rhodobacter sp.]|nr:DUF4065 domain-containing protein [Rhodobacter sp.]MCA3494831.1 DUF4065 domain-containing protein [Rhodobacter sp.]MCA3501184.1 DUF4065 domain-containing protein [Rhodobacter sp.]MCA3504189.1 DUF4065 domain-containing protein [Rhodobacter sp.]MCA3517067.1 DUF4065 domain-containing protein [Rhodobacter sp.]